MSKPGCEGRACCCTGVRWCAACADPAVRRLLGLHPPLSFEISPEAEAGGVEGVEVVADFLTVAEEQETLAAIEARPFEPAQSGKLKQHFGAKVNFKKRRMKLGGFAGLPAYVHQLQARARAAVAPSFECTDAFVLRYDPARRSNLDPHVDDTFAYGELILNVSLQSDCVLTFFEGLDARARWVRVPMPRRSLLALRGPARFRWHHGILADDVQGPRTSITLRTLAPAQRATTDGQRLLEIARLQA